jgi:prephenate dehydrogenase
MEIEKESRAPETRQSENSRFRENEGHTITVAGLGLMGGSFAARLKELHYRVNGWNRTETVTEKALQRHVIDSADEQGISNSDIVILCMPAGCIVPFIQQHLSHFKKGAVLTDISGVKGHLCDEVRACLRPDMDFVMAHPMAGREGQGLDQSSPRIFDGCNYILVPDEKARPESVEKVERLIWQLGAAHVVTVTPAEHDRMIAYTSSLPHILAVSLMDSDSFVEESRYFVAGSFRDGTRVADINASLWARLFLENRENILAEIDNFQKSLDSLRRAVEDNNREQLTRLLEKAGERRRMLSHEKNTR